ncbi:Eac protein, partial [Citrobacter freundii]
LVFAIPNNKEERHGEVEIPGNFQKITYGQFYDIANQQND